MSIVTGLQRSTTVLALCSNFDSICFSPCGFCFRGRAFCTCAGHTSNTSGNRILAFSVDSKFAAQADFSLRCTCYLCCGALLNSRYRYRAALQYKLAYFLRPAACLRARGIGDHVDLPQLVVCGDQSAGKSSVLEGLTGLPFPRQDGVCTKFATEIILQNSNDEQVIVVSIIPSKGHSNTTKAKLRNYSRRLASFDELPSTIEDVGYLIGIRVFKDTREGPAFRKDVLRIEVSGPTGLHLTVVDLPGMISVANEEQTDDDVDTVQNLVDSYVSNPRTIVLAVVQASNDIANQGIIQKSRRFDKKGQRTVGIITKPDLINAGTEKRIALLVKNQDTTKLRLGFFLVKTSSWILIEQRRRNEERYFQCSPWKEQALDQDRLRIQSL